MELVWFKKNYCISNYKQNMLVINLNDKYQTQEHCTFFKVWTEMQTT